MIHFELHENNRVLRLVSASELEHEQIRISMKKRISNWRFDPRVKKKQWDGYFTYLHKDRWVPVGLWKELYTMAKEYQYEIRIDGLERIINEDLHRQEFIDWVNEFFSDHPKIKPRDYQIEAAYKIIKYKLSISEIATNSGKTLILFMVYAYLLSTGQLSKMLVIVPNNQLVNQGFDDFLDYSNEKLRGMKIQLIGGGDRDIREDANIIIGTFQSLTKKEPEYFAGINVVAVDEAHFAKTVSVKNIIANCLDSQWRFGISGTILQLQDSADYFTVQSFLGPLIQKITPEFLFDSGYATPIHIKVIKLDWLDSETKEKLYRLRQSKEMDGSALFNIERKLVIESKKRFEWVCDLISKVSKNSLVLYKDIKDEHGKNVQQRLKELTTGKEIYYVDGGTSGDHREYYKQKLGEGDNKILIASFGTFSTGISISNIHNIFFIESYKSEAIIKQSIGRGMRLCEGKEFVNIIDIVDDFSWSDGKSSSKWGDYAKNNYLMKHSNDRINIYEKENFKYKIYNVKI